MTTNTLTETANSAALPQGNGVDSDFTNNQEADTTLTDKLAQKEKMKEQIKRAKARMKLKEESEEKKELEPEV